PILAIAYPSETNAELFISSYETTTRALGCSGSASGKAGAIFFAGREIEQAYRSEFEAGAAAITWTPRHRCAIVIPCGVPTRAAATRNVTPAVRLPKNAERTRFA